MPLIFPDLTNSAGNTLTVTGFLDAKQITDPSYPVPETGLDGENTIKGNGIFDALMESVTLHMNIQWNQGRIAGEDYTKTYLGLAQTAMEVSVRYALERNNQWMNAKQIELHEAQIAKIKAETETIRLPLDTDTDDTSKTYATALLKSQLKSVEEQWKLLKAQKYVELQKEVLVTAQTQGFKVDAQLKHTKSITDFRGMLDAVNGGSYPMETDESNIWGEDKLSGKENKDKPERWVIQKINNKQINDAITAIDTAISNFPVKDETITPVTGSKTVKVLKPLGLQDKELIQYNKFYL
jgi:hypothetical protein